MPEPVDQRRGRRSSTQAATWFKRAMDDARRDGYEQARAQAETAVYSGEDVLFAWLRQRPEDPSC